MKWFREARFGMFIHWGLYAVPAGKWGNQTGYGEWIRDSARIPVGTYEQFQGQFNPVKFDADTWAKLAKEAGMRYVTITTKHHDGFCLFDSKYTDWDVMGTPFKRDIMKELSTAVRKQGLVQCWYHSIMDWHHPDYLPRRPWEEANRPVGDANMDRYVQYLHNQVQELLTKYGPIGVMWFDGEWERTWNHTYGQALYDWCRKLQPNVIVNNRVDVGRGGMGGMSDAGYAGDYGTPEQEVPATGLPGVDWETCMTMNDHWGYNAVDMNFKSSETLVRLLCDIVSKGGNFLLNVGPTAEGEIPPTSVQRLKDIGAWMKWNSESIYGTTASPFKKLDWGRCTQKPTRGGTALYLQVFDWPKNGKLVVPGLGNDAVSARLLRGQKIALPVERKGSDLVISVPASAPDKYASVVALTIKGKPIVYEAPVINSPSPVFVDKITVGIDPGSKDLEVRYTLDGSAPSTKSAKYSKPFTVTGKTTVVKAATFHHGKQVTPAATVRLTKVAPMPPIDKTRQTPGIVRDVIRGDFDSVKGMAGKQPTTSGTVDSIGLLELDKLEYVGARFKAVIKVDMDDVYTFNLLSDDGAVLKVDGKMVVDHDGLHSPSEKLGQVALARGPHLLEVVWFNKTGGSALAVSWGRIGGKVTPIRREEIWQGE